MSVVEQSYNDSCGLLSVIDNCVKITTHWPMWHIMRAELSFVDISLTTAKSSDGSKANPNGLLCRIWGFRGFFASLLIVQNWFYIACKDYFSNNGRDLLHLMFIILCALITLKIQFSWWLLTSHISKKHWRNEI